MKKIVSFLTSTVLASSVAAVLVTGASSTLAARYDIQVRGEIPVEMMDKAFNDACLVLEHTTEYKCKKDLPPPAGLSADLREGTWGIYVQGGRVVYLNRFLIGPHFDAYAYGVLVHEIVHYISFWSEFGTTQCGDEALAWSVFNEYMVQIGRIDLVNDAWKQGYPQCQTQSTTPR